MNILNRRHALLCRGDRVLIALSGGPDSKALAHLLVLWRRKLGLTLLAAHLHHGLSPQNDQALEISKKTAQELAIPFYSKKVRVKELAKKEKRSIEDAGREARYRFFTELTRRTRANKVATAHTLDDQAETVMMRIVRGCGLHGLSGIPAKRRLGKAQVVRPLLGSRKKDVLKFLKQNGLRFHTDRSNSSARFTRNKVRHKLLPWIEKNMNPSIQETLAGFAERVSSGDRNPGGKR